MTEWKALSMSNMLKYSSTSTLQGRTVHPSSLLSTINDLKRKRVRGDDDKLNKFLDHIGAFLTLEDLDLGIVPKDMEKLIQVATETVQEEAVNSLANRVADLLHSIFIAYQIATPDQQILAALLGYFIGKATPAVTDLAKTVYEEFKWFIEHRKTTYADAVKHCNNPASGEYIGLSRDLNRFKWDPNCRKLALSPQNCPSLMLRSQKNGDMGILFRDKFCGSIVSRDREQY